MMRSKIGRRDKDEGTCGCWSATLEDSWSRFSVRHEHGICSSDACDRSLSFKTAKGHPRTYALIDAAAEKGIAARRTDWLEDFGQIAVSRRGWCMN